MGNDKVVMTGRLQSLDALRGWNMFMLVGGKGLVLALAAAFGLASDGAFVRQFSHVAWHDGVFWDFVSSVRFSYQGAACGLGTRPAWQGTQVD